MLAEAELHQANPDQAVPHSELSQTDGFTRKNSWIKREND